MSLNPDSQKKSSEDLLFCWSDGVTRAPLPIDRHLAQVSKILSNAREVLVAADTGTGKTLRLAQLALQHTGSTPDSKVYVLEPKKVLAIRGAHSVTRELNGAESTGNHKVGGLVGYRLRGMPDRVSDQTRVEFRIKQAFLNEILKSKDRLPEGVIILDEAHDTSWVNDLLIATIAERLNYNPKTSVIYCSATPDIEMFSRFRPNLQVVTCNASLFNVERSVVRLKADEHHSEAALRVTSSLMQRFSEGVLPEPGNNKQAFMSNGTILVLLPGKYDIYQGINTLRNEAKRLQIEQNVDFVPCHSGVSSEILTSIEDPPPKHTLRIILGTDTAREGLTISGVKYVVDSGQIKRQRLSPSGAESLEKIVVDKCALQQGIGRLGRTAPGSHILISSEQDDKNRQDRPTPDVHTSSISALVMHLLMQEKDPKKYDLPHPLDNRQLERTYERLQMIGFIDADGKPTDKGRYGYEQFPFEPEQAAALVRADELEVIPETIVATIGLTKGHPFDAFHGSRTLYLDSAFIYFISQQDGINENLLGPLRLDSAQGLDGCTLEASSPSHKEAMRYLSRISREFFADGDTSDFSALIGVIRDYHQRRSGGLSEQDLETWCKEHLLQHARVRDIYTEARLVCEQLGQSLDQVGHEYDQESVTEALVAGFPHLILRREEKNFSSHDHLKVRQERGSMFTPGDNQFALSSPLSKVNTGRGKVTFSYFAPMLAPVSDSVIINNLNNVLAKVPQPDYRISENGRAIQQRYLYRLHNWTVNSQYETPAATPEAYRYFREKLLSGELSTTKEIAESLEKNSQLMAIMAGSSAAKDSKGGELPLDEESYYRWLEGQLDPSFDAQLLAAERLLLPIARYRLLLLQNVTQAAKGSFS